MPVLRGNVRRRSREATGLALEVMLADAPITASRPGCMPNYIDPASRDCLTFAGCHARPAGRSKLRFPSPRWAQAGACRRAQAAGAVGHAAGHANVVSSRRWPSASPSKYFPPAFKKRDQDKETIFRCLQRLQGLQGLQLHRRDIHDVGHLFDATLTGSRPSFIPTSGKAPRDHSCRRSDAVTAVPMTAHRRSAFYPPYLCLASSKLV
ncbi:unnamed protein product [Symbiodinium sp. CCMP2592]|nr:unnamed protein product [Symbiodinium sp. CCMP2592]